MVRVVAEAISTSSPSSSSGQSGCFEDLSIGDGGCTCCFGVAGGCLNASFNELYLSCDKIVA